MEDQVARDSVYLIGQGICALIELEAMKAANADRVQRGEAQAYSEDQIREITNKYPISHNGVLMTYYP